MRWGRFFGSAPTSSEQDTKGPSTQCQGQRAQGLKRLLADGQEQAAWIPVDADEVLVEETLVEEPANEERLTRTGDEHHERALAPSELLVPRHGQQGLSGVGRTQTVPVAVVLVVLAVDVAIGPLQLLARDELEADLDDAVTLHGVVVVTFKHMFTLRGTLKKEELREFTRKDGTRGQCLPDQDQRL